MKKIIITGGAGFIGSRFAKLCLEKGHNIKIIDKMTYASNMNRLPAYTTVKMLDICDINQRDIEGFDYIVNFAAETHVDNSIKDGKPFIRSNVEGVFNLLEQSRKVGIKKFIQISTDEVYGSLATNDAPFTEDTPLAPNSPYAASKASADLLCRSFCETYGYPITITRCSNNYGPRQNKEKMIPKTINNILDGKKIPVYAQGQNIRDWIYVEDHCKALLNIFYVGKDGEKYNIGGECEIKNIDLVKTIIRLMGASEDLIEFVDDRPGHDLRYAIDNAKIIEAINWHPSNTHEEGLLKTIKWYKNART